VRLETRFALLFAAAAAATSLLPSATAAASPPHALPPAQAVVVTQDGPLRGFVAGGMHQYLGIPYAAPPVGALRWRAPQPPARWQGVRDASAFAPHCPQLAGLFGQGSTSEDCLYLNVYTPENATGKAPVMVWIHGGALITGESDDYDPAALVAQGVVVVTINYRLGLLGFLAHPALEENGASGDYGLMDQQAALRWVKRNIDRFGGDAGNVTIFGESAGGLSVRSQLVSRAAAGLFQRAIVESGAYARTLPTQAQAEAVGQAAAATALGCPDQTAACLRSVPVDTLLAAEATVTTSQLPNVRADVLPLDYATAFSTGAVNRVPVLMGSNHDEWGLFVALYGDLSGHPVTDGTYQAQIQAQFGVPPYLAAGFAALYPPGVYGSASLALRALGTDVVFACNARADVRDLSHYVTAYQYEFADQNAPNIFFPGFPLTFPLGAYHASEIQYLFPTAGSALDAQQQALGGAMQRYWANFARTGDPNGSGLPVWPAYSSAADTAISFVPPTPATTTAFATDHRCAIWTPGG
jgi:para-nitrobenzyl esterase